MDLVAIPLDRTRPTSTRHLLLATLPTFPAKARADTYESDTSIGFLMSAVNDLGLDPVALLAVLTVQPS